MADRTDAHHTTCVRALESLRDPLELDAIAAGRPSRIVYVSCDHATLTRDILRFATFGYKAISLEAFDMFPTTFHLETLTVLERT